MQVLFFVSSTLLLVVGLSISLLLFLKPNLAIEIQRKFYEKINWKIEPISMQQEIRNTKFMGLLLVGIVLLTTIFLLTGTR